MQLRLCLRPRAGLIHRRVLFTVAAASVSKEEAPKAISKVMIGVCAGMVIGVPIASVIANTVSLEMAMSFSAIVNALVFIDERV